MEIQSACFSYVSAPGLSFPADVSGTTVTFYLFGQTSFNYEPFLEEYGFGVSEFGDNTYVVTFVPEVFGKLGEPELIHDIIKNVLAAGRIRNETGLSKKLCKTLDCRVAIKGGAACSTRQMEELAEQLKKTGKTYSCPHGRPTKISFTREKLDRMFARTG